MIRNLNMFFFIVEVFSIENAVLCYCQTGVPTADSVIDCVIDIYHRLLQYVHAKPKLETFGEFTPFERVMGLTDPPGSTVEDVASQWELARQAVAEIMPTLVAAEPMATCTDAMC